MKFSYEYGKTVPEQFVNCKTIPYKPKAEHL